MNLITFKPFVVYVVLVIVVATGYGFNLAVKRSTRDADPWYSPLPFYRALITREGSIMLLCVLGLLVVGFVVLVWSELR